jgi:8-oxo-dGTP diphosphatase
MGETIERAAIRELAEEIDVQATEQDLERAAHLTFYFSNHPDWDQVVHAFIVRQWDGEPVESVEMEPAWHKVSEIPFETMWQDDAHWLPRVLGGEKVKATFTFKADNETVDTVEMEEW